nr:alpha/beta hydrolase fold domain-containing protein [Desulfosarcina cetonica]
MTEASSDAVSIPDKFYFKIGEVAQIAGVLPYVLRFWETEFRQIRPKRTESGQRLYRRQDVLLILRIKHLLYDKKFTIQGARQDLRMKSAERPDPMPAAAKPPDLAEIHDELVRIRELIDAHRLRPSESSGDDGHPPAEKVIDHLRAISAQAFKLIHDLDARRKLIDRYFCVHPSTSHVHGQWHPVKTDHIPMEWVMASGADAHRRILYIHGGSWISGSLAGYRAFLSRISQATGAVVLAVDYRLAPEHPFPAGLDDCVQAYQWMRENGPHNPWPASATFLMGDSAGGNLALASLLKINDDSLPLPTAVVAISPATDFTGKSPSLASRASVDPIIHPDILPALIPIYLAGRLNRPIRMHRRCSVIIPDCRRSCCRSGIGKFCWMIQRVWPSMPPRRGAT